MPLVTAESVVASVPLPAGSEGEHFAQSAAGAVFSREAELYARKALGAPRYAEVLAFEGSQDPENAQAFADLQTAASLIAAVRAAPGTGLRPMSDSGGFIRSTGYDASREELLSPRQIAEYADVLQARADALLGDLKPSGHHPPPLPRRVGTGITRVASRWAR